MGAGKRNDHFVAFYKAPTCKRLIELKMFYCLISKPAHKRSFMTYSNKSSWSRLRLTLFFTLNELLHNPQFGSQSCSKHFNHTRSLLSRCESASEIFITVSALSQDNDSINTWLWYLCRVFSFCTLLLGQILAVFVWARRHRNGKMTAASHLRDLD